MNLLKQVNGELSVDVIELVRLIVRKAWLLILSAIVFGAATYFSALKFITPQYKASVTMYVNNNVGGDSRTYLTQSDLNASAQLVDTYSAIIKNVSVLRAVIQDAGVIVDEHKLLNSVSINSVNDTEVFVVSVSDPNPDVAVKIADSIAKIAPARISDIVEGSSVKIINLAELPTHISSPNYKKITVLGMIIGFVVCFLFIIIQALKDKFIKQESDFERWNYPVLGVVPDLKSSKNTSYGYGTSYGQPGKK